MNKPEMKPYIGVKLLSASEPITKRDYCKYRGWELPKGEDPNEMVRLVEYEADPLSKPNVEGHLGYVSMSPVHVFDAAYRKTSGLTFGLAIEALRKGHCVARQGWNGKGMFICKQVPSEIKSDIVPKMQSLPQSAKDMFQAGFDDDQIDAIYYQNQMIIVKESNVIDSWVASSSDTFAEDWYIVE
jgi:hypothetical protein